MHNNELEIKNKIGAKVRNEREMIFTGAVEEVRIRGAATEKVGTACVLCTSR